MTSCAIPSFTSGLYIDRDHAVFDRPPFRDAAGEPTAKLLRLRTPGNADAVLWSVFRTLQRLDAGRWLSALLATLDASPHLTDRLNGDPHLTPSPAPLPALGEVRGASVKVEFWPSAVLDAVVRAPGLVVGIKANMGTPLLVRADTLDPVGQALTGLLQLAEAETAADIAFLFIAPAVARPRQPLVYDTLLPRYQDAGERAVLLPHRAADELQRLAGRVGWLAWSHVLQAAAGACSRDEDKALVRGLRDWLFWQERRAGLR